MAVDSDLKFSIPKLDEDNYFAWSVRVKAALISKAAWEAVEPGYPAGSVLTEAQEIKNSKALAFLLLVN
ncbi:uncharacterized protein [Bemisia tabaci]|uniref:uncharacterized protein isoform X2 n=1 Tax=Bemisia tabaci TaxID=7038 RepID=UPI003B27FD65